MSTAAYLLAGVSLDDGELVLAEMCISPDPFDQREEGLVVVLSSSECADYEASEAALMGEVEELAQTDQHWAVIWRRLCAWQAQDTKPMHVKLAQDLAVGDVIELGGRKLRIEQVRPAYLTDIKCDHVQLSLSDGDQIYLPVTIAVPCQRGRFFTKPEKGDSDG